VSAFPLIRARKYLRLNGLVVPYRLSTLAYRSKKCRRNISTCNHRIGQETTFPRRAQQRIERSRNIRQTLEGSCCVFYYWHEKVIIVQAAGTCAGNDFRNGRRETKGTPLIGESTFYLFVQKPVPLVITFGNFAGNFRRFRDHRVQFKIWFAVCQIVKR